jgi:regulator of protease activity HflC (stomatin/prohibitin superfamily)
MLVIAGLGMTGCQRISTGEVGLREGFDRQVQKTELLPGSFNQTIVGDVLVFPVKQIAMQLDNLKPQTLDNSTLSDLDITVIYNINPAAVGELYTAESHAFNAIDTKGETLLMYNYLMTVANSAAFKAVNKYNALDVTGHRSQIETDIAVIMSAALKAEKLDTAITIAQVQVKNILPAQSIIDSANAVITSQNQQKAKQVEVGTAKLEAERLAMLSSNGQNVKYMQAKAMQDIAEGVKAGSVKAIVIPWDFKGIVNLGN